MEWNTAEAQAWGQIHLKILSKLQVLKSMYLTILDTFQISINIYQSTITHALGPISAGDQQYVSFNPSELHYGKNDSKVKITKHKLKTGQ